MGAWGLEAWQNDEAADWLCALVERACMSDAVEETLEMGSDAPVERVRAAAWLLSRLAFDGIWPLEDRRAQLQRALERMVEIRESSGGDQSLLDTLDREIAELRARLSETA